MSAKTNFLAACAAVSWTVVDDGSDVDTIAEHLFDHAGRGSDAWSRIMVRVRDGAAAAAAGADVPDIVLQLGEASLRATMAGIALPAQGV